MFLVVAGLVSAVVLLASDEHKWEHVMAGVMVGVIVVAAGMGVLSHYYALLPREHRTICDITGSERTPHYLAYITEAEMDTLLLPLAHGGHDALGESKPGMFGTQGVKCFPKRATEGRMRLDDLANRHGKVGEMVPPSFQYLSESEDGGDRLPSGDAYQGDVGLRRFPYTPPAVVDGHDGRGRLFLRGSNPTMSLQLQALHGRSFCSYDEWLPLSLHHGLVRRVGRDRLHLEVPEMRPEAPYGWTGRQSSSGFFRPAATCTGSFASLDRF
jgi:hypothetical protein